MQHTRFHESFHFMTCRFQNGHYTDARAGAHANFLALMLQGTALIVSEKSRIELKSGDLFFIPKDLPYQSYWHGDPLVEWHSFAFQVFPNPENRQYDLQIIPHTPQERDEILRLAEKRVVDCTNLGRFYSLFGALESRMTYHAPDAIPVRLQGALYCMEQNPSLSVPQIAEQCRMSVSGLYTLFRNGLGKTPVRIKHEILCDRAIERLAGTDRSVESISSDLGFSSSSYFRKVFYEITGKTPSQIRKEHHIM